MNCKKVQEQHVKLGVADLGNCSREGLLGVLFSGEQGREQEPWAACWVLGRACDERKERCGLKDHDQEQPWECWDRDLRLASKRRGFHSP
ncbi:hypothetical protein GOP47_0010079 [Adiantum capillus-veneris]|uniref:Uncharacterized protein n=1 Tax=Adiantum capillus-veneris TaxID=13818 RepID=A0A9D4UV77_ADICA|nr:hypothetical protein GOP47_0010079 [Adiantum capillus-veneris]